MLRQLFDKYNCDKGYKHLYDILYEKDFKDARNKKLNILEIGVLEGASTRAWLEYFPNATLYIVDLFDRVSLEKLPDIINHKRVKWLQHDSTNPSIKAEIAKWDVKFDIIIDDGLHTPAANKATFFNLIDFLKETGTYYIEDVFPFHIMSKNEKDLKFLQKKKNREVWNDKTVSNLLNSLDHFNLDWLDNRHLTKEQDSFIVKIKHKT